jgi:hypothetical protein
LQVHNLQGFFIFQNRHHPGGCSPAFTRKKKPDIPTGSFGGVAVVRCGISDLADVLLHLQINGALLMNSTDEKSD